jgi:hypothetical protein
MPTDLELEAMRLFSELSPENQNMLLMYTRVAHIAENAVKQSVNRALGQENNTMEGV